MVFLQSGMVFLQMNFLPDTVGERRESIMKYNIQGDNLPVVICELDANESMITERGGHGMDVSKYEDGDKDKWNRKGYGTYVFR